MSSERFSKPSLYLGILVLLSIFNFAHRQAPISLGYQIEQGLEIDHSQLGLLIGYAFIVLYSVAGLFFGTVADRWNRPRLIALGLALWASATALSGFAQSFAQIAALRAIVGIGAAVLTPTALAMLSDVFEPQRRAFASGVYYGGLPLGAGLCLIVVAFLEPALGWRNCFLVLGVAGVVFVPLVFMLKDPPRGASSPPEGSSPEPPHDQRSTGEIVRELIRVMAGSPPLAATIAGGVIVVWPVSAAALSVTWLQLERGFTITRAGLLTGVIFLVGGFIGNIGGGWLSDVFQRRWSGGRLWYLAWVQLVLLPPAIAWYLIPPDSPLFYVSWFVACVAGTSYLGPLFATIQDLVPARIRSSAVGFMLFFMNIFGTGAAPWVAGILGDAWNLTRSLVICSLVGFLSVPMFVFAARRCGGAKVAQPLVAP